MERKILGISFDGTEVRIFHLAGAGAGVGAESGAGAGARAGARTQVRAQAGYLCMVLLLSLIQLVTARIATPGDGLAKLQLQGKYC